MKATAVSRPKQRAARERRGVGADAKSPRVKRFPSRASLTRLEELTNIGPSIAGDLRLIGISRPADLVGKDPYALYDRLCVARGVRQDPCVLDVFISAVRYMEGAPARPWYRYTAERKRTLADR
jgi:hypothetical protein